MIEIKVNNMPRYEVICPKCTSIITFDDSDKRLRYNDYDGELHDYTCIVCPCCKKHIVLDGDGENVANYVKISDKFNFTYEDLMDLSYSAEAIKSLNMICKYNPMTLEHCYEICALMAPLCDRKTASGAIEWLKTKIKEDKD